MDRNRPLLDPRFAAAGFCFSAGALTGDDVNIRKIVFAAGCVHATLPNGEVIALDGVLRIHLVRPTIGGIPLESYSQDGSVSLSLPVPPSNQSALGITLSQRPSVFRKPKLPPVPATPPVLDPRLSELGFTVEGRLLVAPATIEGLRFVQRDTGIEVILRDGETVFTPGLTLSAGTMNAPSGGKPGVNLS